MRVEVRPEAFLNRHRFSTSSGSAKAWLSLPTYGFGGTEATLSSPESAHEAHAPRKRWIGWDAGNVEALLGFATIAVSWASSIYALKWVWRSIAGVSDRGRARG